MRPRRDDDENEPEPMPDDLWYDFVLLCERFGVTAVPVTLLRELLEPQRRDTLSVAVEAKRLDMAHDAGA